MSFLSKMVNALEYILCCKVTYILCTIKHFNGTNIFWAGTEVRIQHYDTKQQGLFT